MHALFSQSHTLVNGRSTTRPSHRLKAQPTLTAAPALPPAGPKATCSYRPSFFAFVPASSTRTRRAPRRPPCASTGDLSATRGQPKWRRASRSACHRLRDRSLADSATPHFRPPRGSRFDVERGARRRRRCTVRRRVWEGRGGPPRTLRHGRPPQLATAAATDAAAAAQEPELGHDFDFRLYLQRRTAYIFSKLVRRPAAPAVRRRLSRACRPYAALRAARARAAARTASPVPFFLRRRGAP